MLSCIVISHSLYSLSVDHLPPAFSQILDTLFSRILSLQSWLNSCFFSCLDSVSFSNNEEQQSKCGKEAKILTERKTIPGTVMTLWLLKTHHSSTGNANKASGQVWKPMPGRSLIICVLEAQVLWRHYWEVAEQQRWMPLGGNFPQKGLRKFPSHGDIKKSKSGHAHTSLDVCIIVISFQQFMSLSLHASKWMSPRGIKSKVVRW